MSHLIKFPHWALTFEKDNIFRTGLSVDGISTFATFAEAKSELVSHWTNAEIELRKLSKTCSGEEKKHNLSMMMFSKKMKDKVKKISIKGEQMPV